MTTTIVGSCLVPLTILAFMLPLPFLVSAELACLRLHRRCLSQRKLCVGWHRCRLDVAAIRRQGSIALLAPTSF